MKKNTRKFGLALTALMLVALLLSSSLVTATLAATYNYDVGPNDLADGPTFLNGRGGVPFGHDPDMPPPMGSSQDGPAGFGSSSFYSDVQGSAAGPRDYTAFRMSPRDIFGVSDVTISDLSAISYYTKWVSDLDWQIKIYTEDVTDPIQWYQTRIEWNRPSPGDNAWHQYTADGLTIGKLTVKDAGDQTIPGTGLLSDLDADYGSEKILFIDIIASYASSSPPSYSYLDGVSITLDTTDIATMNLTQPSEVWVDDGFTSSTPGWGITHFDNIQDGIDAVEGSTVNVAAGTYTEYLYINKDGLTIEATAGYTTTIIDLDGLTPYWHYGMLSSSFSGRGGVSIDGYQNTGGTADLVENVTFKGFTVKNAGVNYPRSAEGSHDGADDAGSLHDTGAFTSMNLAGQWLINKDDYVDNSGGRQFARYNITNNTDDEITATYISGGDDTNWDTGDTYVISPYREWYDGALEGRDDVRGIRIVSGKGIVIQDCKVQYSGGSGITTGKSRHGPKLPSENITIDNCNVSDNHHAGIATGDTKGTITITDNTVSNNNNPTTQGCTYSGVGPPDCHVTGMHIGGVKNDPLSGTISGNTVSGNAYHGITVYKYTDGITVENNTVTGHNLNSEGAGIFLSTGWGFDKHCRNHTVIGNTVTGNIRGIIAYYAWDSTVLNP